MQLSNSKPIVLFVDHSADLGGGEIAMLDIIRRLDRSRFDPAAMLFSDGPLADILRSEGIILEIMNPDHGFVNVRRTAVRVLSLRGLRHAWESLRFSRRVAHRIREINAAVVYCNSLKANLIGGTAARFARVPCIWHVRDRIESDYLKPAIARLFRLAARVLPTQIIANSQATAETLHLNDGKVEVIYSGTDWNDKFPFEPKSPPFSKVGIVGRITPWKGQDVFIRAASLVLRQKPEIKFQIIGGVQVGDEAYQQDCLDLIEELGLGSHIELTGFRSDVADVMRKLDIVVHASTLPEPFGQVIAQAMALGRPIIASDGGGAVELIPDASFGSRIPSQDPHLLSSEILRLIDDPDYALSRVQKARNHVKDHFSIGATVDRVERVIASCLDSAKATRSNAASLTVPEVPREVTGRGSSRFPDLVALPRKILFLNHTAKPGGGEIALLNMVKQIDRSIYLPRAVFFEQGEMVARFQAAGVETEVLPLAKIALEQRKGELGVLSPATLRTVGASLHYVRLLTKYIMCVKPDIIYTNSLKADILGGLAARCAGVPCLWHVRDRISSDYLPARSAAFFRLCASLIPKQIITNSAATAKSLKAGRARIKNLSVVHDGTPFASNSMADVVLSMRPATAPPQVFGLVGRIAPWKGTDVFIRAARIVHDTYPHVRFAIVGAPLFGEDDYAADCRRLVDELAMRDVMEFRGFANDVISEFERLDAVVHASVLPEPFGQVIVEAMALARPVIASDAGAVPEILPDDSVGLKVRPGDPECLARAMIRLISEPIVCKQIAAAGQAHARRHFAIERTVGGIQEVLKTIVADGPRRPYIEESHGIAMPSANS